LYVAHSELLLRRGFAAKVDKKTAAVAAAGLPPHCTTRTVRAIQLRRTSPVSSYSSSSSTNKDTYIDLDFHLDGALYKMVRNVVGAMLAVSCGTLAVRDIEGVFADGLWAGGEKHKTAAMPAPAHGLTLERVFYGDETEELLGTGVRAGRQNWL
jgi:tRNA U38,U39,U40 pseudouridine synthase TruA